MNDDPTDNLETWICNEANRVVGADGLVLVSQVIEEALRLAQLRQPMCEEEVPPTVKAAFQYLFYRAMHEFGWDDYLDRATQRAVRGTDIDASYLFTETLDRLIHKNPIYLSKLYIDQAIYWKKLSIICSTPNLIDYGAYIDLRNSTNGWQPQFISKTFLDLAKGSNNIRACIDVDVFDMTYKDIAANEDISYCAARKRVERGRETLRGLSSSCEEARVKALKP